MNFASRQLYQDVILDHNRKPRNYGRLEAADRRAEGLNPLCGDHIWVDLKLRDETVEAIGFHGDSCAICKASASLMTVSVKGKSVDDALRLVDSFRGMTTGELDAEAEAQLGRLAVFSGVRDLPSRVKCAILPWHTLRAAFQQTASVSTEGEHDPLPDR